MPIRTEVSNPKFELKPQMLATLTINGTHIKQLAVPASAVVRENDKDYVFVQLTDRRFRLTEVTLDPPSGNTVRCARDWMKVHLSSSMAASI